MTRKKVKIKYITNDVNRRTSFNKWKKCLVKKVHKHITLSRIEACAIVFGEDDSKPKVWHSSLGVQHMIAKFKNLLDFQQASKMENQERFTYEWIERAREVLRKMKQENREKEMTNVMFNCLAGEGSSEINVVDLNEIQSLTDSRINDIISRIEALKKAREIHLPSTVLRT